MNPSIERKPFLTSLSSFLLTIILIPVVIIIWTNVARNLEYDSLKSDVNRVESQGGLAPLVVDCHDVELSARCYVDYSPVSSSNFKRALEESGYEVEMSKSGSINAFRSQSKSEVFVSGGPDKVISSAVSFRKR